MPSELVYEGKTVEHALKRASKALNLPQDEIKHEVISYGSSGIFGIVGAKKAKIRISLSIRSSKKKEPDERSAPKATDNEKKAKQEDIKPKDATVLNAASDSAEKKIEVRLETEQAGQEGLERLKQLVSYISDEAVVTLEIKRNVIVYDIHGGNSAVLIGRRGQTLDALQYITEKIVNKQTQLRKKVRVDVEGYIEKRKNNLRKTARKIAEKVKKVGKPMSIGQMNSHDRRIVHLALKNDRGVRTQSLGDGVLRKLVIFPKKGKTTNQKKNNKQTN